MSALGKLLGLLLVKRSFTDTTPLISRLLTGIATVIILSMISAILGGILLVGALYVLYTTLVEHGLNEGAAMTILAALLAVAVAVLVVQIRDHIRRLRRIPELVMRKQSPLAERASTIGYAFMDGFLNQPAGGRTAHTRR